MSEDERHERIRAVAEIIDDFMSEEHAFVLVVFPRETPEAKTTIKFDIISNHIDRTYVANVLDHVLKGIDQHMLEEDEPETGRPN